MISINRLEQLTRHLEKFKLELNRPQDADLEYVQNFLNGEIADEQGPIIDQLLGEWNLQIAFTDALHNDFPRGWDSSIAQTALSEQEIELVECYGVEGHFKAYKIYDGEILFSVFDVPNGTRPCCDRATLDQFACETLCKAISWDGLRRRTDTEHSIKTSITDIEVQLERISHMKNEEWLQKLLLEATQKLFQLSQIARATRKDIQK